MWLTRLFTRSPAPPPPQPPQPDQNSVESRLHRLEVQNRDLAARLAALESEHYQLLAPIKVRFE